MSDPVLEEKLSDEQSESYDTSDKEQVNKARKRDARTRADRLEFVEAAMTTPQGRAWFYDLLARCHVVRTPFSANDPYGTAFKCGEQNIGLQILDDIQTVSSDTYLTMITENKKKNK